jgi:hypothetical protein
MTMIFENLTYLIIVITLIVMGFKTYLFFSSSRNKRWANWFFFNHYALYNSRSERSRKLKLLQNNLTWIIVSLVFFDAIVFLLFNGKGA